MEQLAHEKRTNARVHASHPPEAETRETERHLKESGADPERSEYKPNQPETHRSHYGSARDMCTLLYDVPPILPLRARVSQT